MILVKLEMLDEMREKKYEYEFGGTRSTIRYIKLTTEKPTT